MSGGRPPRQMSAEKGIPRQFSGSREPPRRMSPTLNPPPGSYPQQSEPNRLPIVQQPTVITPIIQSTTEPEATTDTSEVPVFIEVIPEGLDWLIPLSLLFVQQKFEPTGPGGAIDLADHYDIINGNGRRIFRANLQLTKALSCSCSRSGKPFEVEVNDSYGNRVLNLLRKPNCCQADMTVTLSDGTRLGSIVQQSCCTPTFDIRDEKEKNIMIMTGPPTGECCTGRDDYAITTTDGHRLGIIRKTFIGCFEEYFTDADNFGIEFVINLDVHWKALMLAAIFLIDFMYYETSARKRQPQPHEPDYPGQPQL